MSLVACNFKTVIPSSEILFRYLITAFWDGDTRKKEKRILIRDLICSNGRSVASSSYQIITGKTITLPKLVPGD